MIRHFLLFPVLALALLFSLPAAAQDVTGVWSTVDGESHVKIEPCGNKFCGKIIWLKEPLTEKKIAKTDIKNENVSLRGQPIEGLEILKGFIQEKKNEWDDGTIYNPKDGKTYSSTLTLTKPDELEVDGCVMIFCKTQVWTRVE
ncbi:DUF2147 domain-containing protein [uncultured Sneathiella sp.]|uniref:DUF2147 domain-containing protein n=1 Tax=uncultured Sneathiella sp. TaxID=879315 RepID=UPI0030EED456|tara:strand:+ start:14741 stop:15172 length:432 start_codon:yes stop_codon:yes gene_type:complete